MQTIFDIGMFDGSDTDYYLSLGHRVVAVEANPDLVADARRRFEAQVHSGQLSCIHAAISERGEPLQLSLAGTDLGSSSVFHDRTAHKRPMGVVEVPGLSMQALIAEHGVPHFIKVDIEGADRFAVLPLTPESRPAFLSFEIGHDADELLSHTIALGYRRFKVINQNSFREIANLDTWRDRGVRKLFHLLGYADPRRVRRAGRYFKVDHSSGPVPWHSDGHWRSAQSVQSLLKSTELPGWNDIHATV